MSQENVAAVQAALKFARDELDGLDEFWTDDIDHRAGEDVSDKPAAIRNLPILSPEDVLDDCGPIHGKAEMRAYLQDWFDTFDDFRAEPVELIDAGEDQVVAVLRIMGRAKLSGVETDLTYAALYTIRDGKIARGREYWTKDQALEAAGLRE